jgi:hypothetical protein
MLMAKVHNGNIGRGKHILNDFFSVGEEWTSWSPNINNSIQCKNHEHNTYRLQQIK